LKNQSLLYNFNIIHYTLAKIFKELLNPINIFELDEIVYQLNNVTLSNFEVDDYVLNIDLQYIRNQANILTFIGSEICHSNQFELIISNKTEENNHAKLSLSFLHHQLDFLIDAYNNNTNNMPKDALDIIHSLKFNIPKHNLKSQKIEDIQKLILWAQEFNIRQNILPSSEDELLNLEILNLSDLQLDFIPKEIRVLQNLKKLYLVNNNLCDLPLEIFSLKNLEVLWVQENKLTYLSKEIKNLVNLKELILYDNSIQKLPKKMNLQSLEFIALHRNSLSQKEINRFLAALPNNIDFSTYEQKTVFPFYIEPLSYLTLAEAEKLRDVVFTDIDEDEKKLLRVSLSPRENKSILKINEIQTIHYWVVRENISAKIIGLTGIYTEVEDDNEDCWLGWFCIDDRYREKGFGKKLLDFSIEMVQKMDKKVLHIYTYDIKKHSRAIEMYKKYGFKKYDVKNTKYKKDLYFKKEIQSLEIKGKKIFDSVYTQHTQLINNLSDK